MEKQTLQLIFHTDNGKSYTINIDNPKDPDIDAINDCVDNIVDSNIFMTKNGTLVGVKEVRLVTKTVDTIDLA